MPSSTILSVTGGTVTISRVMTIFCGSALTGSNHGHVQVRAGLAQQQIVDLGERHLARALAFDGFEDIAGLDAGLVGGTARNHRDDRGIAESASILPLRSRLWLRSGWPCTL